MRLRAVLFLLLLASTRPQAQESEETCEEADKEQRLASLQRVDVVVGIMTAPEGEKGAARRDATWESWGDLASNSPELIGTVQVVFVVGHKRRQEESSVSSAANLHHDLHFNASWTPFPVHDEQGRSRAPLPLLTVPVFDSYDAVIYKFVHFCRWSLRSTSARFLVKTDDDTYVHLPSLVSTLVGGGGSAGSSTFRTPHRRLYYGQFCTGAPTRTRGHKNYVPESCYPLASYPPYAHGSAYALSRDMFGFVARNAYAFVSGTINRCILDNCTATMASGQRDGVDGVGGRDAASGGGGGVSRSTVSLSQEPETGDEDWFALASLLAERPPERRATATAKEPASSSSSPESSSTVDSDWSKRSGDFDGNGIARSSNGGGGSSSSTSSSSSSSNVSSNHVRVEQHDAGPASDGGCFNARGQLPSLEDVQVALWVSPLRAEQVHDHRLVSASGCHSRAIAVWDLPPPVMRAIGLSVRRQRAQWRQGETKTNPPPPPPPSDDNDNDNDGAGGTNGSPPPSNPAAAAAASSHFPSSPSSSATEFRPWLCVGELMAYAATHFEEHSLDSAFANGGHRFPRNHQVYYLYYNYFYTLVRANRFSDAMEAWATATSFAPSAPAAAPMEPMANYLRVQLLRDGCRRCQQDLHEILDSMAQNNGKSTSLCSSTSGNYDSLDYSLMLLVDHIKSRY